MAEMRSRDTDPEAKRVQLELLRKMSVAQRIDLARALTTSALQLTHRAIWEAHPGDSPDEHLARFVAQVYGADLGAEVRRDFEARRGHQQP